MSLGRRACVGLAAFLSVFIVGTRGTQNAIANGDTRTLTFYHNNTKESLTVTFRRNGQYDSRALEQINWFMRDWRRAEATKMDPRLFDTIWEVYREVGSSAPVQVNSAYRSPNTNAMLRRRSSVVAKNSQHMLGKALDFYLSDVSATQLRAIGMRLQNGGVGYYPNAYTPFVHLDVGSVRAWPRMTRDQLTRIFPDGKTVHIPADGTPLAGYAEAKAEVLARGGTVAGYTMVADAGEVAQPRRKSFWETLFGGSDEDEDVEEIRTASRPGRSIFASRETPASSPYANDRESTTSVLQAYNDTQGRPAQPTRVARAPQPEPEDEPMPARQVAAAPPPPAAFREELTNPPLPPTRIAGLPSTVSTPSGPALAWQQGPSAAGPDMSLSKDAAFAPMPPRRPDAVAVSETQAVAYAPMPPARPSTLAATNPIPALPELRGASNAVASLDPADIAPMPPRRPSELRAITVASASAADLPVEAMTPSPKEKDKKAEKAEKTKPVVPAPETTASIRAGSKAAASAAKPSAPSVLTANSAGLNMSFSSKPMGDLATGKFTGPAVKPLQVR